MWGMGLFRQLLRLAGVRAGGADYGGCRELRNGYMVRMTIGAFRTKSDDNVRTDPAQVKRQFVPLPQMLRRGPNSPSI